MFAVLFVFGREFEIFISTYNNSNLLISLGPEKEGEDSLTSSFRGDVLQALTMLKQWRDIDRMGYIPSFVNNATQSVLGVPDFASGGDVNMATNNSSSIGCVDSNSYGVDVEEDAATTSKKGQDHEHIAASSNANAPTMSN